MIFKNNFLPYIIILGAAGIVYGLIYIFAGEFNPLAVNWYNSYSRQAARWLEGYLHLAEDIPWLEIARFQGRYYISFPPFPSVVMLPFVLAFGITTPDHVIALAVSLLSLVYAYKIANLLLANKAHAVFISLFLVLGTNYLHIALWGAVWYIAQNLAFLLTLMAFYYALTPNKKHSFISLFAMCAAMGCRPFNIFYVPVVLWLIFMREEGEFVPFAKKIFVYAAPAFVLGAFFMWLNFTRFGSIFEFGHNFLPEFDYVDKFQLSSMPDNLRRMLFNFNLTDSPMFHGFAFWVASPIFVSYAVYLFMYGFKGAKPTLETCLIFALPVLIALHLLAFSSHLTLGGHQFGARYTVDTLAAVFLGLLFIMKNIPQDNRVYLNFAPFLFGLLLNFYGTVDFLAFYF
ncbi:MAG: hypothetical protein FWB96_00075 [Defluviitaleaceae bacterium]|nr:hypothetical protein [Defluviitaleaceae bacterium]MCL2262560.1 hypothetical protein [Defluviitaleaceae bacterium]